MKWLDWTFVFSWFSSKGFISRHALEQMPLVRTRCGHIGSVALPLPSRPRTERAVSGYWCYTGSRSTDLAKGWCIYLYRIDIYIYHIYTIYIYIYHIYIYIPLYTIVALPLPRRPRTERAVSGYWCYNGSRSTDLAKGWCIYLYRIDTYTYIYIPYIYIPLYTIYIYI